VAIAATDWLTKREPEAPAQHTTPWPSDKPFPRPGDPAFDQFTVYVDEETGESLVPS
jgi:hypothetical protein